MNNRRKAKRCSTCATRKIACDLKYPACSQCLLTGKECPGYHRDHVFLQQIIAKPSSKHEKQKIKASRTSRDKSEKPDPQKASSRPSKSKMNHRSAVKYTISTVPVSASSTDDILIQTIIENFTPFQEIGLVNIGDKSAVSLNSRMCGAWVTLLPDLFAESATGAGVLCIATRALGTAISGRPKKDESLISEALDLVCRGLKALRTVLDALAASMCFNITEVLLGTSHNGWSVHMHGIAELVKDRGPAKFMTGTAHQLFISFRIFMLLEYIQKRNSTFLADPEWLSIPFSIEPKSSMQTLLDAASSLPCLLDEFDKFGGKQPVAECATADDIYEELSAVQTNLLKWEADLTSAHDVPLWWPVSSSLPKNPEKVDEDQVFPISYYFPNILTANTMTHYWAFLAITLSTKSHLNELTQHAQSQPQSDTPSKFQDNPHSDRSPIELSALASNICASMAYHMHSSQKLYGPASTFFPLWIALQIFERDLSPESKKKELWCRDFIKELEKRGLPLAGYLVGCPGI